MTGRDPPLGGSFTILLLRAILMANKLSHQ